jgi:hypothetical protein
VQVGSRARIYQVALTEPYVVDRPITAGIDLYSPGREALITVTFSLLDKKEADDAKKSDDHDDLNDVQLTKRST